MTALTRKEILDALGGHQRADTLSIDLGAFAAYLVDESDRGTVVVLGSVVEDVLADKIFKSFTRTDPAFKKDLLRGGSLLASWNDKTKLALGLGIIDDDDAADIEVLAAMRNACAHSRQKIDFSTPALRDALALLMRGAAPEGILEIKNPMFLRTAFVVAVSHIVAKIKGETEQETITRVGQLFAAIFPDGVPPDASPKKPRPQSKR